MKENWTPKDAWRRFRLEAEAAKNYPLPYAMYLGQTHRDLLLDSILPTLLYLKAVAILDDALELWLEDNGHVLRKPYKADLNGRLEYLHDKSLLDNVDALHKIREKRNAYAHQPNAACPWSLLEQDIGTIEASLVCLRLARVTKNLEYFSERSALEPSSEPGVTYSRRFKYGVKEDGIVALELAWEQRFHE